MDQLIKFFDLDHDDNILYVDLHMLQAWLLVAPYSKLHTLLTELFHKGVGDNVKITNCMSYFSIFVPTKTNVKLANGNMWHAQVIGIILCYFTNCPIIYIVGPFY